MRKDIIYHFIGIGGVSMSGLALILMQEGYKVQGSNINKNLHTDMLKNNGVQIFLRHHKENVLNADIIVYTDAISKDNPELIQAKLDKKQIFSRAEMLEIISKEYENVIAISGSHGKTTTTGMITEVFIQAGLNPTAHIGGVLKKLNTNTIVGDKKFFITEACEFKANFLHLKPTLSVILNVEAEHMDYFKTFENALNSYQAFSDNSLKLIKYEKVTIKNNNTILYGAKGYNARRVKKLPNGKYSFTCYFEDKKLFKVKLNSVGKHNIYNALATIAVSKEFNISDNLIIKGLENFSGILRRYEIVKESPLIVHDYAHHPAEIASTILATRSFKKQRIIVAFQPHTYSRTQSLMPEFGNAFEGCDELVIIKTYSAREKYSAKGSAKALFLTLQKKYKDVKYFNNFNKVHEYLVESLKKGDTVLLLGAGNIDKLAKMFEEI